MTAVLIYLALGVALSLICTREDKNVWKVDVFHAILIVLAWPLVVWFIVQMAQTLKYKDKLIWERKRK
jgi:hypothetical protein